MDLLTLQDSHVYSYLQKWILSPGYPLIKVTLKNSTDVEVVEITHKRFVYPMDNMPSYDNDDWDIPLSRTTQSEKNFNKTIDVFYTPEGLTFTNEDGGWIMLNMQGGSFYRVNYDETLWRRIIRSLKGEERKDIHVLNRAQLVDDIFSIARIGDVNYSLAFELAEFLVDETDYYPWYSALNAFTYIMGKI
ncbi:hypothetical protein NQ314_006143 [Rhamnusium bicolor]|uniref:ERAP1-like C-terminal domain-containing protein n=1 Tax=Rhamnusium bicolor TaxID=1586634 RepID=A0AAV8Z841_9CUCU|nr:hypothetical protein NQ314_006143 [Rhamnusium bicolor]